MKLSYSSNILLYSKYEVYFKYTFRDILTSKVCKFMKIIEKYFKVCMFQVYSESIKNLLMKYTSNIEMYLYFFSDSEVYLK